MSSLILEIDRMREIMGLESNGMILCASKDDLPVILQPEKEVLPGIKIK